MGRVATRGFVAWIGLILGWLVPATAAADPVCADLDQDGIVDVVSVERAPAHGLLFWFSRTGATGRIPTHGPIIGAVAADVDGDGRVELVTADEHTQVHVWRVSHSGRVRHEQTHRRRLTGWRTGPSLERDREVTPVVLVADAVTPLLPASGTHAVRLTASVRCRHSGRSRTASGAIVPSPSRAPPLAAR